MKSITEVLWHNRTLYPTNGRIQSCQSLTSSVDELDSSNATDRRSRANSPTWTTWASMSSNSVLRHFRHQADDTSTHLEVLDLENSGKLQDNVTSKRDSGKLYMSLSKDKVLNDTDFPISGVGEKLLDIQDSATTVTTDIEKYLDICLLQRKSLGKVNTSKPEDTVTKSSKPVTENTVFELRQGGHRFQCSPIENRSSCEFKSNCSSSMDVDAAWKKSDLEKLKANTHDLVSSDSCSSSTVRSFENNVQRIAEETLASITRLISNESSGGRKVHSQQNRRSEGDGTDYHITKNEVEKIPKYLLNFNNRCEEKDITEIFIEQYGNTEKATSSERLKEKDSDSRERNQNYFNGGDTHSGARKNKCPISKEDETNQSNQSKFVGSAFKSTIRMSDSERRPKQCSPSSSSVDTDPAARRKSVVTRIQGLGGTSLSVREKQSIVLAHDENMASIVSHCKLEPGETAENDVEKCVSRNSSCMTPDSLMFHSQSTDTITSSSSQPLHRAAVNNQVRNFIRSLIPDENPLQSTSLSFRIDERKTKLGISNCVDSEECDTIKNDEDASVVITDLEASKQNDNKLSFLAYLMDAGYLAKKRRKTLSNSTTLVSNDASLKNLLSPKELKAISYDRHSSGSESCKTLKKIKCKKPERRLWGVLNVEKIIPTRKVSGKHKAFDAENILTSEMTGCQSLRNDCANLVGWTLGEGQEKHCEAGPSITRADVPNPPESCSGHNETVIAFDVSDVTDFAYEATNQQTDRHEFFDNGTDGDIFNPFSVARVSSGEQNSTSETLFGVNSFESSTISNSVSDSTSSSEEITTGSENKHLFGTLNMFSAKNMRITKRNTQKAATSSGRTGINVKEHIGAYQTNSAYSRALIQSTFASNMLLKNTCGYSSYKAPTCIKCIPPVLSPRPAAQEIRTFEDAFNVCSWVLLSPSKNISDDEFEAKLPQEVCSNLSVTKPVRFSSYLEKLNTITPDITETQQFVHGESGGGRTPREKDTHYVCTPSPRPLLTISASSHVSPMYRSFRSKRFPKQPYYFSVHSNASKSKQENERVHMMRSAVSNQLSSPMDKCQLGQLCDNLQSRCAMVEPRFENFKWNNSTRLHGLACKRRRKFPERFSRPSIAKQALTTNSLYREYTSFGGDLPPRNVSMKSLASHRLFPSGSIWRKSRLKHFPSCPIGLQARRKINGYKKCLKNLYDHEHLKKCEHKQDGVQGCKSGAPTNNRQIKVAKVRNNRGEKEAFKNPICENSIKRCKKGLADLRNAYKGPKITQLSLEKNSKISAATHKNTTSCKSVGFVGMTKSTVKHKEKKCLQPVSKKDNKIPGTQSEESVKFKSVDVFSRLYPNSTPGRCIRNTRSICNELVQAFKTDSSCQGSFIMKDVQRLWKMDREMERKDMLSQSTVATNSSEISETNIKKIMQSKDVAVTEDICSHRRMIECIKLILRKQTEALDAINASLNILERPKDRCQEEDRNSKNEPDVSNCNKEIVNVTTVTKSETMLSRSELQRSASSKGRPMKEGHVISIGSSKQRVTIENCDKLSVVSSSTNQDGAMTPKLMLSPRRLSPLHHSPRFVGDRVHVHLPRLGGQTQCNVGSSLLSDFSFENKPKPRLSLGSNVSQSIPFSTVPKDTISAPNEDKFPANDDISELSGVKFYPSPYALSCRSSCSKKTLGVANQSSRFNLYIPKTKEFHADFKSQPQNKLQVSHNAEGNLLEPTKYKELNSTKSALDVGIHNQQANVRLPVVLKPHQNNNSCLPKPTTCPTCIPTTGQQAVVVKHDDSRYACYAACPCLELWLKKFVTPYLDENFGTPTVKPPCSANQVETLNDLQTRNQNLVNSIHNHNQCACSQTQQHIQANTANQSCGEVSHYSETNAVNNSLLLAPGIHGSNQGSSSGFLCCHSHNESVVVSNQSQALTIIPVNAKQTSGLSGTSGLSSEVELYQEVTKTIESLTAIHEQDGPLLQRSEFLDEKVEQLGTCTACKESDILGKNETTKWIHSEDEKLAFDVTSQNMVTQTFKYLKSFENNKLGETSTSEKLSTTVESACTSTCHNNDVTGGDICGRSQQGNLVFYESQSLNATSESVDTGQIIICRHVREEEQTETETRDIGSKELSLINQSQAPSTRRDDFSQESFTTGTDEREEKLGIEEDLKKVTTKPLAIQKQRFGIKSWFSKPEPLFKNLKRSESKPPKQEIRKDCAPKEQQDVGKSARRFRRSLLISSKKSQVKPYSTTATIEKTDAVVIQPKKRIEASVSSSNDRNKKNPAHEEKAKDNVRQERNQNNSKFPSKHPEDQSVSTFTTLSKSSQSKKKFTVSVTI